MTPWLWFVLAYAGGFCSGVVSTVLRLWRLADEEDAREAVRRRIATCGPCARCGEFPGHWRHDPRVLASHAYEAPTTGAEATA